MMSKQKAEKAPREAQKNNTDIVAVLYKKANIPIVAHQKQEKKLKVFTKKCKHLQRLQKQSKSASQQRASFRKNWTI